MTTVFIVNPKAGQGKASERIIESIKKASTDAEIYITKAVGDAMNIVKNYCKEKGVARFIACGGDGTLNEAVNGAADFPDAEIGVIPCGTGNDFCRNFDAKYNFSDPLGQIKGKTVKCDAIQYTTVLEGETVKSLGVNMFNIGFDCNVADLTCRMKKKPFLSGSLAYFASIFVSLVKKKCTDLAVEIDGELKHKGKLLLTSAANGAFCGGGIKSNPMAFVNDGIMNVNIIKNVSRCRFISLLPSYMKGTVLEKKNINRFIESVNCRKITITPKCEKIRLCVDGEITDAGQITFEVIPNAFNFVLPEA